MKILYITTDIGWGGSSVALYNIITELKDRHQIFVLLPSDKGRFGQELKKIGVTCFEKPFGLNVYPRFHNFVEFCKHNWWFIRGLYRKYKAKKCVESILDTIQPDIVHVNVGPVDISLDACIKRNIPHVWHLREYQDKDFSMHYFPSKKYFRRRIATKGNYCISISNDIFNHWHLRMGIDRVIYDGVIPSAQIPLNYKKEKYFLFVGRIQKAKGVLEALIAFHDFSLFNNEYKMLIAGNWDSSNQYKSICDDYILQHNMEGSVTFLGQRTDVHELMAKASAILVPSHFEGFGFITAEAMYNNCIVIGRNTGGTKEQFDIGLNETGDEIGLRFNRNEEIPVLMQRVVNEDLSKMRELAIQTVCKHYLSSICAKQVEFFYNDIVPKINKDAK